MCCCFQVAVVKEIEAEDVSMFEKEPELPAGRKLDIDR